MPSLARDQFDHLVSPGPRLPWLIGWLLNEVWSRERYQAMEPLKYLQEGETSVNDLEQIIAAGAFRLYDEMITAPPPDRDVGLFLEQQQPCAVIIFDGLSLREMPALLQLASESKLTPQEIGVSLAAFPSETVDFCDQRLGCGRAAPSQLPSRRELSNLGITAAYYDHPNQQHRLDSDDQAFLLWSSFPDNTYKDSGARFAQHFQQIHEVLKTAWLNTVQQVPVGRKILVTSDHGYIFFGPGMSFPRSRDDVRPLTRYLGGERYRRFSEVDEPPPEHPDLAVYPDRHLAIIRGRVQTHPPGQAANKLYKHGGLSFMEMLVPWLVLEG